MIVVCCIAAFGCTCSPDLNTPKEMDPSTTSLLRIVHAAIGNGDLTCRQNDRMLADRIVYARIADGYRTLPSGLRNLRFSDAGSDGNRLTANVDLGIETPHTFVLYGSGTELRGSIVADVPPDVRAGIAHVRIIHAAYAAGMATLAADDSIVTSVLYPTFPPYVAMHGDRAWVDVIDNGSTQRLDLPANVLDPGTAWTVIVLRQQASTGAPLDVLVMKDR